MTRNGASPIIRKSTINVIGTLALRRASRIMFQKIANVLSIISFLMVSSMSVGAYLAIQYMRSPEFERTLKNKIMGDLKEKMIEEILQLELDSEIKKYHEELDEKILKPKIIETGKFGEDGWSISIGDVEDGDT
jgi:ABC-type nickel/cobalt efflux system permease component RcnA